MFFNRVKENNYEEVKEMLKYNRYLVYECDHSMRTPLHFSCKNNYLEIT